MEDGEGKMGVWGWGAWRVWGWGVKCENVKCEK